MKKRLFIVFFIFSVLLLTGCQKNNSLSNNEEIIDKSKFSAPKVIEYLESRNFQFRIDEHTSIKTTRYVYVPNDESGITIQKITNYYLGTMYLWKNEDINDEWAYIRGEYQNDSDNEKKQYKEYQKWLEYEGLTTKQVVEALDYFDEHN